MIKTIPQIKTSAGQSALLLVDDPEDDLVIILGVTNYGYVPHSICLSHQVYIDKITEILTDNPKFVSLSYISFKSKNIHGLLPWGLRTSLSNFNRMNFFEAESKYLADMKNWIHVDINTKIHQDMNQILRWLMDNVGQCGMDWYMIDSTVGFKKFDDAVNFKLTWC